jgi:hypothetical protein
MEGISLPVTLLKPILDEFQSALVKDSEKTPTYPFTLSRFALIKLILVRLERQRQEPIALADNTSRKVAVHGVIECDRTVAGVAGKGER